MSETLDRDTAAASEDDTIVTEAHTRFDRCVEWESTFRGHAKDDKRFANGDAYNRYQWDDVALNIRNDRPCLTVNKTRQHLLQICNDQRQHKAQIKISPTGGDATYEAAQIRAALIRRIEAHSKATDAYSTAGYDQVETGLGFCRVITEYVSEHSFDQDIRIVREPEPLSIYLDPDAKDYDKADMRFAFKFRDMPPDQFKSEYGDHDVGTNDDPLGAGRMSTSWVTKDHVRVCEYFRRLDRDDNLHLMQDGSVVRESDQEDGWGRRNRAKIQRTRSSTRTEVEWFLIAGRKVIDRKPWPGKYIPIVPWIGEEYVIDGRMDRRGHTRALLDPQRIYNYASSSSAEFIGLQTKSPYVGSVRAFEGRPEWEEANLKNLPYLAFNDIDEDGKPIERPTREQPPVAAQAYIELMKTAQQEMMLVSGQYQENFGQQSNAQSGVAISQRERQGDNATFHYIDNHAKGVRQIGRIVNDLLPKIYDTARVVQIMAMDGTQSDVHVDPHLATAHAHAIVGPNGQHQMIDADQAKQADNDPALPDVKTFFNPTMGEYGVDVDVGPAFDTQRQEGANALTQVMAQNKEVVPWTLDIWAGMQDFPGADVLRDRARRMVPPQALGGPPPEMLQMQQRMTAMKQEGEHRIVALQQQVNDLTQKSKNRDADIERQDYEAETRRLATVASVDPEAVKPIIRQLVSEVLQTPIVPVMAMHAQAEQAMQPPDPGQQPSPAQPPEQPQVPQ